MTKEKGKDQSTKKKKQGEVVNKRGEPKKENSPQKRRSKEKQNPKKKRTLKERWMMTSA